MSTDKKSYAHWIHRFTTGRSIDTFPCDLHRMIASVPLLSTSSETSNIWIQIALHCRSNPNEAIMKDRSGRSCLHAACAKRPTPEAVGVLRKYCTDACVRDNHGRTPLAISVLSNASIEVVRALLFEKGSLAARVADNANALPLHLLACVGRDNPEAEGLFSLVLDAFPDAAGMEMNGDKTPLYLAVEYSADPRIIGMLARAKPEAVIMCRCGDTPLSLAINCSPIQTITNLVKANPLAMKKRDEKGMTPLHIAVIRKTSMNIIGFLCDSTESLRLKDNKGCTALHLALEDSFISRLDIVKCLLKKDPTVSLMANNSGKTPLDMACSRYLRFGTNRNEPYYIQPKNWRLLMAHIKSPPEDYISWKSSQSEMIYLLLRAAYTGSVETAHPNRFQVLHAAVALGLPVEIVNHTIEHHREQLLLPGKRGKLPLLLALERPIVDEEVVRLLVEASPKAASTPDESGQIALTIIAGNRNIGTDILRRIISAFPESLSITDPNSGLYPFMLAALPLRKFVSGIVMRHVTQGDVASCRRDLLQMNMIYELIKACPDLILMK